jgi:hypothetical protein
MSMIQDAYSSFLKELLTRSVIVDSENVYFNVKMSFLILSFICVRLYTNLVDRYVTQISKLEDNCRQHFGEKVQKTNS